MYLFLDNPHITSWILDSNELGSPSVDKYLEATVPLVAHSGGRWRTRRPRRRPLVQLDDFTANPACDTTAAPTIGSHAFIYPWLENWWMRCKYALWAQQGGCVRLGRDGHGGWASS